MGKEKNIYQNRMKKKNPLQHEEKYDKVTAGRESSKTNTERRLTAKLKAQEAEKDAVRCSFTRKLFACNVNLTGIFIFKEWR